MTKHSLILASASPRRLQLLRQIGIEPEVVPADIDESLLADEVPAAYVERMAIEKATAVHAQLDHPKPVLGADTTVVVENKILAKPENEQDAIRMLSLLSGRWHDVITGVCLINENSMQYRTSITRVQFRSVTIDQIKAYWRTGEPQDKAGAYAIQGKGALFVERIEGSFSGVVGLPIEVIYDLLAEQGIPVW